MPFLHCNHFFIIILSLLCDVLLLVFFFDLAVSIVLTLHCLCLPVLFSKYIKKRIDCIFSNNKKGSLLNTDWIAIALRAAKNWAHLHSLTWLNLVNSSWNSPFPLSRQKRPASADTCASLDKAVDSTLAAGLWLCISEFTLWNAFRKIWRHLKLISWTGQWSGRFSATWLDLWVAAGLNPLSLWKFLRHSIWLNFLTMAEFVVGSSLPSRPCQGSAALGYSLQVPCSSYRGWDCYCPTGDHRLSSRLLLITLVVSSNPTITDLTATMYMQ